MFTKNTKIWYVGFPTYQYNENVQELAKASGARIIDARFDDGTGSDLPKLTLKNAGKPKKSAKKVPTETLYDVYKITDGEKGKRPSKANVTETEAKEWMSGRDEDYEMVVSD